MKFKFNFEASQIPQCQRMNNLSMGILVQELSSSKVNTRETSKEKTAIREGREFAV